DGHMSVRDHLAALGPAGREAEPGHDIVEPALEQRHQGRARIARSAARHVVVFPELTLEDPVVALDLLLLAEANRILARLSAAKLMHAGHTLAAIDGAFRRVAPRALQEQLHPLAATKPAHWTNMTSHEMLSTNLVGLIGRIFRLGNGAELGVLGRS